jgi:hypothetical protein
MNYKGLLGIFFVLIILFGCKSKALAAYRASNELAAKKE